VLSGDLEWCAMRVWREFHRDDAASVVGLEEAMATLCGRLRHQDLPTRYVASRRLATCLEFLSARLETPPRLSEVARISGVHPMHLARLFRQRFGYSMGEYVRRSRIAWACDLLQQDGRTIGETAIRVGFADHAHFTRTFVRVTGCTPRWYRSRVLQSRVFRRF
jgi:AraC family transcriptional regulator